MSEIIVISDTHFGAGKNDAERQSAFINLLKTHRGKEIVLLGDIFDFWIEYKSAIYKRYFNILCELKQFIDNSGRVYFIPGNHDFYSTDFFSSIGMLVMHKGLTIERSGRRIFMHHGDVFSKKGKFNRFFYGNFVNRFVFKLLHPDIGINIAAFVSKTSYKRPGGGKVVMPEGIERLYSFYDIIITGHTHTPGVLKIDAEKYYINSGEWLFGKSYVKITHNEIVVFRENVILDSIQI